MNQRNFLYKLNSHVNIMLTLPVNHDHAIAQNINNDLLIFLTCTRHLKTPHYCLQMAELPVNTCTLYETYMITGHTKTYDHWPLI